MGIRGEVFSAKAHTAKRTYFFNVKENRNGDLFLNVVESSRTNESDNFERRSIVVYKEDIGEFLRGFDAAVHFIKEKRT